MLWHIAAKMTQHTARRHRIQCECSFWKGWLYFLCCSFQTAKSEKTMTTGNIGWTCYAPLMITWPWYRQNF